jgi:uncharacterized SAM-dependent methyltransferase
VPIAENVAIDQSQFPESVQNDLLNSLRSRQIQAKFHYDSHKQAQKWLALHDAFSPARLDPDCLAIYDRAFKAAAALVADAGVRVVGLGCGGGQKDARLLQILAARGVPLAYLPCDSSVPLVLTALRAAKAISPSLCVDPLVCDLGTCASLSHTISQVADHTGRPESRMVTFFGVIPNFEPNLIVPRLAGLMREGDSLLFSANLAPGPDYKAGVQRVLPGYDNLLTRQWLSIFLFDIGAERSDGEIQFSIEDSPDGYKRIAADFHFSTNREILFSPYRFDFKTGDRIRLFFSYRYQPAHIQTLLQRHNLQITQQWITPSEEEGVFLVRLSA